MYNLSRLMLIACVPVYLYSAVVLVVFCGMVSPAVGWALIFLALLILARKRKRIFGTLSAHGTAVWADEDTLRRGGMLDARRGLILGRLVGGSKAGLLAGIKALVNGRLKAKDACGKFFAAFGRAKPAPLVGLPQAITTVCFAPPGAGKSTGLVINFLLTCEESCVVIDFSGELSMATSLARRQRFGQDIQILDPYKVVTESRKLPFKTATFNALDWIDKDSPLALDECNEIGQALVVRTGDEKDGQHWLDCAEDHISAAAATVVQYGTPGSRSLQEVADILARNDKLDLALKLMQQCPAWNGMLARKGAGLTHFVDKEKSSVLTTCGRFLRWLNTPAMAASTRSSSFNPAKLKRERMTTYVVLPPEFMKAGMGWLRLIVTSMIRAVVREGIGEHPNVHFVLDESSSLGVLDAVEDLVDKYRKYGLRGQFYYQSAGQLAKCWPKDQGQTLMSAAAKVYFSVADLTTAQVVSSMLGKSTIIVEGGSTGTSGGSTSGWSEGAGGPGHSGGSNSGWSRGDSWQQSPRELLKPEEVMALPPRIAITFPGGGLSPICTKLVRYFEEPRLGRGEHLLSRFVAACRTLAGSTLLLTTGLALAVLLTAALQGLSRPQVSFPGEPAAVPEQAPPAASPLPGPVPAPAPTATPARKPVRPLVPRGAITRAQLAPLVRRGGYGSLDEAQKAACTGFYLADLRTLRTAVGDRLRVSLASIPGFQGRAQYAQMVRALQLLDRAIADLAQHGTATDPTQYQRLIDEVDQALRRR